MNEEKDAIIHGLKENITQLDTMDWVFAEKDQAIAELDRKEQDQSQELKTGAGQAAGMDQAELDIGQVKEAYEQVKLLEMDKA